MNLTYTVRRGRNTGAVLKPHRNRQCKIVVSPTRFKKNHFFCDTDEEAWELMRKHGFSIRMSDRNSPVCRAPSLIAYERVKVAHT